VAMGVVGGGDLVEQGAVTCEPCDRAVAEFDTEART
jgi:hypothetical protein